MHAEYGVVGPFSRRATDAIVTITQNLNPELLVFLRGKQNVDGRKTKNSTRQQNAKIMLLPLAHLGQSVESSEQLVQDLHQVGRRVRGRYGREPNDVGVQYTENE